MMIRKASMDDVESLLRMGRHFIEGIGFDRLRFNPGSSIGLIHMLTTNENSTLLVAEEEEYQPIGMIGGIAAANVLDSTLIEATEFFWWVEQEHRSSNAGGKLLAAFEKWGLEKGAHWIRMSALEGTMMKPLEEFYESRGYKPIERSFALEV